MCTQILCGTHFHPQRTFREVMFLQEMNDHDNIIKYVSQGKPSYPTTTPLQARISKFCVQLVLINIVCVFIFFPHFHNHFNKEVFILNLRVNL
jgi:hypothetical protein